MGWNARNDLLERGFRKIESREFERFERDGITAYLAYEVLAPQVALIRLSRGQHSVDVLSPQSLDLAIEILAAHQYHGAMQTVEPANGNSGHEDNGGSNSNLKPELEAIAVSIQQIAIELRNGLAALAEALEVLVAQPKE